MFFDVGEQFSLCFLGLASKPVQVPGTGLCLKLYITN